MKQITLILTLIYSLFFATQAHSWVETAGFEGGTIGQQALGADALDNGGYGNTTFTDEVVRNGTRSAKVTAIQGLSDWGAFNLFPSNLGEGDEIWMRYYLYFPAGFNFSATGIGLKTMRIHTTPGTSSGFGGHIDVLIGSNGLNIFNEVAGDDFVNYWLAQSGEAVPIRGNVVPTNTWHAIEQYVKFSSVPGNAIYRIWQNGTLVFEDTANITLKSPTSVSDFNFVFGFWNGDAPATQSAYFDDFVVASDTPSNVDASGNPFIGLSSTTFVSAPKPPVINSVVVVQ